MLHRGSQRGTPPPPTHTPCSVCCPVGGQEEEEEKMRCLRRQRLIERGRSDTGHQQTLTGPLLHRDTLPDLSGGRPAHIISLSRIRKNVLWEAVELKKQRFSCRANAQQKTLTEWGKSLKSLLRFDHKLPRLPAQEEEKDGGTHTNTSLDKCIGTAPVLVLAERNN